MEQESDRARELIPAGDDAARENVTTTTVTNKREDNDDSYNHSDIFIDYGKSLNTVYISLRSCISNHLQSPSLGTESMDSKSPHILLRFNATT